MIRIEYYPRLNKYLITRRHFKIWLMRLSSIAAHDTFVNLSGACAWVANEGHCEETDYNLALFDRLYWSIRISTYFGDFANREWVNDTRIDRITSNSVFA